MAPAIHVRWGSKKGKECSLDGPWTCWNVRVLPYDCHRASNPFSDSFQRTTNEDWMAELSATTLCRTNDTQRQYDESYNYEVVVLTLQCSKQRVLPTFLSLTDTYLALTLPLFNEPATYDVTLPLKKWNLWISMCSYSSNIIVTTKCLIADLELNKAQVRIYDLGNFLPCVEWSYDACEHVGNISCDRELPMWSGNLATSVLSLKCCVGGARGSAAGWGAMI
jgi:hypothetical protein